jgi:hypothetical protein
MAVLVAAVLVSNLPAGRPREELRPAAARDVLPLGLDQDWALFAPDPRGFSVGVYARVTYADGDERRWVPPRGGHLLAPYRTYRWQKYVERLRADDYSSLWEPTARWVADQAGPPAQRQRDGGDEQDGQGGVRRAERHHPRAAVDVRQRPLHAVVTEEGAGVRQQRQRPADREQPDGDAQGRHGRGVDRVERPAVPGPDHRTSRV